MQPQPGTWSCLPLHKHYLPAFPEEKVTGSLRYARPASSQVEGRTRSCLTMAPWGEGEDVASAIRCNGEKHGGEEGRGNWSSCKRVASCPTLAIDLSPSRQLLAARTTFVFFFSTLSSTSTTCDNLYFLVVGQKKYLAAAREP